MSPSWNPLGGKSASPDGHVSLRSGEKLDMTIAEYDSERPLIADRTLRSVCYAPFVSMDFDATGAVRLCNHSHTEIGRVSQGQSIMEMWRGAVYERFRKDFSEYKFDEDNCPHCVRQCQAGSSHHVFATEQFDKIADDERYPKYPKQLIFRLNSTCNLACVMCDALTSSRIRKEREGLSPLPSNYDDAFFEEMEEILPHVEHLEFYGGEPFLVKEHMRIFEILQRIETKCTIYVNTNTTAFNPAAKKALETLNFSVIAVSIDGVSDPVHESVRRGMDNRIFMRNLDYLLELREKRGLTVIFNVTEHRKNWFELPMVFRLAEERRIPIHVNTCIHPHNVALYTMPDDQLRYVYRYFVQQREELNAEFPEFMNARSWDFLISLSRDDLSRRGPDWTPENSIINSHSDGLLRAPIPGIAPFDNPEAVSREARRIVENLSMETATRMLTDMADSARKRCEGPEWDAVKSTLEHLSTNNRAARVIRGEAGEAEQTGSVTVARRLAMEGDHQGCLEELARVSPFSPDWPQTASLRAMCLRETGDLDGAILALQEALSIDPTNVRLLTELGWHHIARARFEEAADAGRRIQEALAGENTPTDDPRFGEAGRIEAHATRRNGDHDGADRILAKLMESHSNDPAVIAELAWLRFDQARFDEGIQAAESIENDAGARDVLPLLYSRAGRFDDALRVIDSVLTEQPGNAVLELRRCWILFDAGRLSDAEAGAKTITESGMQNEVQDLVNSIRAQREAAAP